MTGTAHPGDHGSWLAARTEQQGLQRYLTTLRDRWWVVALAVAVCIGSAIAYLAATPKTYKAYADMLVTPISANDDSVIGLGLIQTSNDPTRDVSTASRFITTTDVARRVVARLRLEDTPAALLKRVTAEPLAQSSVVTIIARSRSAKEAAAIANAFAEETVADRTATLRRQLDLTIPILRARLTGLSAIERQGATALSARLGALEALRGVPDPTISQTVRADVPDHASSPRPRLTLGAGVLAGLLLGLGGAFAAQAIDPRLRREEQLRAIYQVPILARVPQEPHSRKAGALTPEQLSSSAVEAYRTLRATLAASHSTDFRSHSVLVTGSTPGEGKSTTAINFAHSLVQTGNRVILIEADMHRPTIGSALDLRPRYGLSSVLLRQVALEDALVTSELYGPDLQLLLVERPGLEAADRLALPTARTLVADAEALADFVVIDSPPLTEVIDALPFAQEVGDILVVVRLNKSKIPRLLDLGEILGRHDLQPAGVVLVGVERSRGAGYYYARESAEPPRKTVDA